MSASNPIASATSADTSTLLTWDWIQSPLPSRPKSSLNLLKFFFLYPMQQWLDDVRVQDSRLAHRLCKLIPAQCPFERDVQLFGKTLFHIPPMCKLNPWYEQVVALRFRALCYLADECGEDVSPYC